MIGSWKIAIFVGCSLFSGAKQNPKTNMTMQKQPLEDISPIKHVDFPVPF